MDEQETGTQQKTVTWPLSFHPSNLHRAGGCWFTCTHAQDWPWRPRRSSTRRRRRRRRGPEREQEQEQEWVRQKRRAKLGGRREAESMWRRSKHACLRATQFAKLLFSPHLADSSYLHISTGGPSKTHTYIEIEIEIEIERGLLKSSALVTLRSYLIV